MGYSCEESDLLFADDFVGMSDSSENLQKLRLSISFVIGGS